MPRQVPTPRTVEIPSAEAVAKERERLQYKKEIQPHAAQHDLRAAGRGRTGRAGRHDFFCRCWRMN